MSTESTANQTRLRMVKRVAELEEELAEARASARYHGQSAETWARMSEKTESGELFRVAERRANEYAIALHKLREELAELRTYKENTEREIVASYEKGDEILMKDGKYYRLLKRRPTAPVEGQ